MTLQAYWLIVPLAGIALSGFGWLVLLLTRRRAAEQSEEKAA